jgi:CheY-like chemotaxis protein/anti-sigma regulatory factor (Ser/Thr protein kinase)
VDTDNIEIDNLFGDAYKLQQILVNLISNAIKFTEEGVVLLVIKSYETTDGVQCEILIEDTGIGIDKAHLDKIFDEFHQLEFYLTKKIKGTGLGLTIAKKLIEILGGTMKVESQTGKGSRFYLTIPFEPEKIIKTESIMSSTMEKSNSEKEKIKILLAEDNEANQFLIKAITKTKNWDILVVDNGQQAVDKFKDDHFDLVLMDVQMPVKNGYEATREIREIEKEKGTYTPIIALTAYAMKSDKDLCIEAGMDDYISKPFKRQQFLETIIDQLNKKKEK